MLEDKVRECLDTGNQQLLDEIEKMIPVKFTFWGSDCYSCLVHKDELGAQCEAEIFYKEPLVQSKIAHELLHAKTSIILGDNGSMLTIDNQSVPYKCLMKEIASNIVNVCEHVIFFPDYLNMGYKEEDCFELPQNLNQSKQVLAFFKLRGLKENGHYSVEKVFNYLTLTFSFLFYPNQNRFKKEIKILRNVDFPLFSIVNNLKNACFDCEIVPKNRSFIQQSYLEFADKLNDWFANAFKGAVMMSKK